MPATMSPLTRSLVTLLAWNTLQIKFAEAQSVFCHYMAGQVNIPMSDSRLKYSKD